LPKFQNDKKSNDRSLTKSQQKRSILSIALLSTLFIWKTMSRSLKIRNNYIEQAKLAVKRNGFRSQRGLAEDTGLALSTVSNFLTGKPVDYATFVEICDKLSLDSEAIADLNDRIAQTSAKEILETKYTNPHQDWAEAVDVSVFYDRTAELAALQEWIVKDRCRIVALLGMGGIGKTTLSVKLAKEIQSDFDCIIWRSLRNAPPIEDLLDNLLQFLSNQQEIVIPDSFDEKLSLLISRLRASRCLLILDNAESILQGGNRTGRYREGYDRYGQLINCIGQTEHNSCLILTSREIPKDLIALAGETLPVRCWKLSGLPADQGRKICETKGISSGSEEEWSDLIDRYAGNPLALKIVASAIGDFFDRDIASFLAFLAQGSFIFDELRDLLQQQFQRLTSLEKEVMYWLAIDRESVSLQDLQANFVGSISHGELLQALISLERRSLIEKRNGLYTQQPVVMEYALTEFIERTAEEIIDRTFILLRSHALVKATARDCIRETQIRLILQPTCEKLLAFFGSSANVENHLQQSLSIIQEKSDREMDYAAGNIINLLRQL
jgi:DNA-binding HxlR family transcriptional regulator